MERIIPIRITGPAMAVMGTTDSSEDMATPVTAVLADTEETAAVAVMAAAIIKVFEVTSVSGG
jgi:hypothetical protein